jgi:hypothetical protein
VSPAPLLSRHPQATDGNIDGASTDDNRILGLFSVPVWRPFSAVVLVLFGMRSGALSSRIGRDYVTVPKASSWIQGLENVFLKDQRLNIQDVSPPCFG